MDEPQWRQEGFWSGLAVGLTVLGQYVWRYIRREDSSQTKPRIIVPADTLAAVEKVDHELSRVNQRIEDFIQEENRTHAAILTELRGSMAEIRTIVRGK